MIREDYSTFRAEFRFALRLKPLYAAADLYILIIPPPADRYESFSVTLGRYDEPRCAHIGQFDVILGKQRIPDAGNRIQWLIPWRSANSDSGWGRMKRLRRESEIAVRTLTMKRRGYI